MGFGKGVQKGNSSALVSMSFTYHGYSYNKNVITKLFNSGFGKELKGGYKI